MDSSSVFVLDPSCRVAKQTSGMRIAAGQRVVVLEPGGQGMNVLDWIDTSHGLATAHVRSVVHMIGKPRPENDNSDPMWQASARGILFAVLAHMLWDSRLSRGEKSLARFARMVAIPERDLRGFLQEIHEQSECELARIVAGTLMGAPEKTFGGFYRSAQSDIEWLLTPGYGNLVSGSDLGTDDLANGRTTVYLQIPMDTLEDTPEVARTIINALLRGIYRRNGDVQGRILFLLDEVNLLGEMKALQIARDNARKYGVTLVPMWQSLGQLAGTWKDGGKSAWMESSSWQIFAAISHEHTLEEVSKRCGTYTALGRSESATRGSNGGTGGGLSSRSQNYGLSEISVPLIRPQEIQWLPREARIVLRHGAHALLCHAALWFNRPEMKLRIEE
jgi:type IV secretion system protein VirD4